VHRVDPVSWDDRIQDRLEGVRRAGRWRAPRTLDALGPRGRLAGGAADLVSFASNDYLGLSAHPGVIEAAHRALDRWGAGSGASRLVTGSRPVHDELESRLARWKSAEAAVCLPTGFAANLGVLTCFGTPGTQVFSDELNHASIVDGCRLSRAEVTVYPHGDMKQLAKLLEANDGPSIVVTDSVFSMDGDVAPLVELCSLCREHDALLVLDEAHAVLGPDLPIDERDTMMVLRVGTLSKTLGSLGGFVVGPRPAVDLLVNSARPYIFSTALSPADAAAALAALDVVCSEEGEGLRRRLAGLVQRLSPGHLTPILPVVLGSEDAAISASQALLHQGIWVPAIRPPSVPPGTSRLRVTLSAIHRDEEVERLAAALSELGWPRPVEG
jgi:8-amino-7-oxononanoate synthase